MEEKMKVFDFDYNLMYLVDAKVMKLSQPFKIFEQVDAYCGVLPNMVD